MVIRTGDINISSGAHLRGKPLHLTALVNMGSNRVALCRFRDLSNPYIYSQIPKDRPTFNVSLFISGGSTLAQKLNIPHWTVMMVNETELDMIKAANPDVTASVFQSNPLKLLNISPEVAKPAGAFSAREVLAEIDRLLGRDNKNK